MKANGINKIQHKFYRKCANKSQKSGIIRCVMQGYPANNRMQGLQGPCTGNCAGPVRAAYTGPVSI